MSSAESSAPPTPLITAIIPTYKRPELLRRSVVSVLNQNVDRIRISIFDNASNDATSTVVSDMQSRDPRITYHVHPTNIGALANFNFAMSQVATPYFSLLSDDDILLPNFYANALQSLEANSVAHFFCGRTAVFDERNDTIRSYGASWSPGLHHPSIETGVHMIREHVPWTGILWRTELLTKLNQLDGFGSDDNFIVMAALLEPFLVSDQHTAVFFNNSGHGQTGSLLAGRTQAPTDEPSAYFIQVLGRPVRLQADILASNLIDMRTKLAMFDALTDERRKDLLAYLLFTVLPADRPGEMATVLGLLDSTGLALQWRLLFRVILWVARREGIGARFLSKGSKLVVLVRDARRKRRRRRTRLNSEVRRAVKAVEDRTRTWR